MSENSLESNVEMLSDSQSIVELSTDIPNENTCEKPLEPHSSFDMNPTTTHTMVEGEDLIRMDLENYPAQKLFKISNFLEWKQ